MDKLQINSKYQSRKLSGQNDQNYFELWGLENCNLFDYWFLLFVF